MAGRESKLLAFGVGRRAAVSTSSEATKARGSTFGPNIRSAPTGERLPVAPATRPEGSGAMSMHTAPSLPACVASSDALAYGSHSIFSRALHRRVSSASNASCQPKTDYGSPMDATIDLHASRMASGGVGGEEGASIDGRLDGLDRGGGSGRLQRLWGPGGG